MVTGGTTGGNRNDELVSTETYVSDASSWVTSTAKLPRPMMGLRVANIDGRVLIFGKIKLYSSHTRYYRNIIITGGGYYDYRNDFHAYDDILEYDIMENNFQEIGNMLQARSYHAVSVVQVQDYSKWCQ